MQEAERGVVEADAGEDDLDAQLLRDLEGVELLTDDEEEQALEYHHSNASPGNSANSSGAAMSMDEAPICSIEELLARANAQAEAEQLEEDRQTGGSSTLAALEALLDDAGSPFEQLSRWHR